MKTSSPFSLSTIAAASLSSAMLLTGCGGGGGGTQAVVAPPSTPNSCTTAAVTTTHTATTIAPQQLVVLDTVKYPQAKCNDCSAATYVLRPGAGAAASRWIISLQGGGECYDQASCSNRAASMPNLVSTADYQANPSSALGQAGLQGSMPSTNPDFYDATQVTILYCSSDDWSGAKASSSAFNGSNPATWNFQGHAILSSVVADLSASHGLSSATESC